MLPSWLAIAIVSFAVAFTINRVFPTNLRWFNRLRRPRWLTFEWAIPFIWISIFICGAWSAYCVWESDTGSAVSWLLMAFYLLVEVAIFLYTPVMCALRSLRAGTIIGATGFFLGLILTLLVFPISRTGGFLLLPYLLWSPIGTFVTWQMISLNPADA